MAMPEMKVQSQSQRSSKILLVTPVWNDTSRLAIFGGKLAAHLARSDYDLEWMIADDGSGPRERKELTQLYDELRQTFENMSLHFAGEHRGKGAVVREAWAERPDAEWYVFVDADGSLSPPELSRVLDLGLKKRQTILPIRKRTANTEVDLTVLRRIVHKLFILAVRMIVGVRCTDPQCGAKMIKADDYHKIAPSLHEDGLAFDTEMLTAMAENGVLWHELPVTWIERDGGKVKPMRDAWGMLAALCKIRKRQRAGEFA